jgi:4'-phosphopantetheinyl transferase EntD
MPDLHTLFPAGVALCVAGHDMFDGGLFCEEARLVAQAVPKRQAEFAAGRNAARAALAKLGAAAQPILSGPYREPLWPHGFVGSITHCDGFCCAVAARSSLLVSLGIDAEPAGPLDQEVTGAVCRPDERDHFSQLPALAGSNWEKLAFSAKEAFHKCHYPVFGQHLEFKEVSVRFALAAGGNAGSFAITILKSEAHRASPARLRGAWMIDGARVYAGASYLRGTAEATATEVLR